MLSYVIKRLVYGALTVFFIATATFVAMHNIPGDPISNDKAMLPEIRANVEKQYGLDKPAFPITLSPFGVHLDNQYFRFIRDLARFDFGLSFRQQNRRVNDIIRSHFPVSAAIGVFALIFATLGGIAFGSIAALSRGRRIDGWVMFWVVLGVSVPNFVFAALGQWGLVKLNERVGETVLPVGGWSSYPVELGGWAFDVPYFKYLLLPSVVLGIATLAFLTRLMRSSMLEVIHQDYIRTAKAKGVPRRRIFVSHQLRNAVLPVITYLGPAVATITTGGFVVEHVFAIPGLGKYFVEAFQQLDYTVIMGLTIFYGSFLVFMVIVVDILYGFIDPRIKVEK